MRVRVRPATSSTTSSSQLSSLNKDDGGRWSGARASDVGGCFSPAPSLAFGSLRRPEKNHAIASADPSLRSGSCLRRTQGIFSKSGCMGRVEESAFAGAAFVLDSCACPTSLQPKCRLVSKAKKRRTCRRSRRLYSPRRLRRDAKPNFQGPLRGIGFHGSSTWTNSTESDSSESASILRGTRRTARRFPGPSFAAPRSSRFFAPQ